MLFTNEILLRVLLIDKYNGTKIKEDNSSYTNKFRAYLGEYLACRYSGYSMFPSKGCTAFKTSLSSASLQKGKARCSLHTCVGEEK